MYSAEVLSQLRSLNWLAQEFRRLPADSREGGKIRKQMESLRDRLPTAILTYHDRLAARGLPSAAEVHAGSCAACHIRLPRGLAGELVVPGRFAVCPNCGVFLWSAEVAPTPETTVEKRAPARARRQAAAKPGAPVASV